MVGNAIIHILSIQLAQLVQQNFIPGLVFSLLELESWSFSGAAL